MEEPSPGSSNILTSLEEESFPSTFDLSAYPNPFNPSTTVQYQISEMSDVEFKIYDILGREIWNYFESDKPAGLYKVMWNGMNSSGQKVSSGIYFLRMTAAKFSKSVKLMLMK